MKSYIVNTREHKQIKGFLYPLLVNNNNTSNNANDGDDNDDDDDDDEGDV